MRLFPLRALQACVISLLTTAAAICGAQVPTIGPPQATLAPALQLALPDELDDEGDAAFRSDSERVAPTNAELSSHPLTPNGATAARATPAAQDSSERDEAEADIAGDEPGDAIATMRAGSLVARVGSQKLSYNSLIHSDLDRLGAIAEWDIDRDLQLRGFGSGAHKLKGFGRLLGSDEADYRVNGFIVEQNLHLPGADEAKLLGGWVSGSASADNAHQRNGRAWSLASNAALAAGRMRLHLEYAGSELDGLRAHGERDSDSITGEAYRSRVEFVAPAVAAFPWRAGSEYSRVSAQFGSLANPTLATDKASVKTFAAVALGEVKLDLSWDRGQSNLLRDPTRPVSQSDYTKLVASWSSDTLVGLSLLGRPSYRIATDVGNKRQLATSASEARSEPRSLLSLQTEFAQPTWLWGVKAKGGRVAGAIDAPVPAGLHSLAFDLYGDMHGFEHLPVKPVISWQRKRDLATGTTSRRWRAGLAAPSFALRHDLLADFDLGLQRRVRSDGVEEDLAAKFSGKLRWMVERPTPSRSGLALELSGRFVASHTDTGANGDDFLFMVSLSSQGEGNGH